MHWIYIANNWGIYVSWIYILVLDIFCQQLGDICQLEDVCLRNMLFLKNVDISQPCARRAHRHPLIDTYCWQNISNTNIYIQLTYIPQLLAVYIQYKYMKYRGTICRGPTCRTRIFQGPSLPQQNFQFAAKGPNLPPRGPICRGPICRGPICRGPICHQQVFRGPICRTQDFLGPNLPGAPFAGAQSAGAQFAGAQSAGAQFAAKNRSGPNLPGPNLPRTGIPSPHK